jgi:hypothetical protein
MPRLYPWPLPQKNISAQLYRAARGRQDFGVHGTPYVLPENFLEKRYRGF